jgi:hypothetical protein
LFWLNYVVTLDSDTQASIMVDVQHRLLGVKAWTVNQYLAMRTWLLNLAGSLIAVGQGKLGDPLRLAVALGALLTAVLALVLGFYLRRQFMHSFYSPGWRRFLVWPAWRYKRLARLDHKASAVLFYQQMLTIAARGGLVRQSHETPVEFAANSKFDEIQEITTLYNRVRFGSAALDEAEVRRVSRLLGEFRTALRNRDAATRNWLQRLFPGGGKG